MIEKMRNQLTSLLDAKCQLEKQDTVIEGLEAKNEAQDEVIKGLEAKKLLIGAIESVKANLHAEKEARS
jgi:hypothetical protein